MDSTFFVLAVVAALVVAGVGLYLQHKRREALQEFAAAQGWAYDRRDDSLVRRWAGPPFQRGSSRRATNVLRGTFEGVPMTAFDYQYTVRSGSGDNRSSTTYRFGVCVMALPTAMPDLQVVPEGIFGRMRSALGFSGISLESEDFNRAFRVSCGDARFASDVLHPRMMERLLADPGEGWRFEGADAVLFDEGRQSPAEIMRRVRLLRDVLGAVPDFVWRGRGVDPQTIRSAA